MPPHHARDITLLLILRECYYLLSIEFDTHDELDCHSRFVDMSWWQEKEKRIRIIMTNSREFLRHAMIG